MTTSDAPHSGTGAPFEMAGLRQNKTGLPFYVWLSLRAGSRHDVRIKCSASHRHDPSHETIIGLRPSIHIVHGQMSTPDFRLVSLWIDLNRETILAFWNEDIDDDEMKSRIKAL